MNIKHIQTEEDQGAEPNAPSVASMRESQAKGNTGIGLADQSYCESLKDFNQGCSDCPL